MCKFPEIKWLTSLCSAEPTALAFVQLTDAHAEARKTM